MVWWQAPVTSEFGAYDEGTPLRGGHAHSGIDYGVPEGTVITPVAPGVVVEAGQNPGYGNYVVVDHGGGITTLYGHLRSIAVRPGQRVTQAVPLGESGSTGAVTGAHVHLEARLGGRPVDPRTVLQGGMVSMTTQNQGLPTVGDLYRRLQDAIRKRDDAQRRMNEIANTKYKGDHEKAAEKDAEYRQAAQTLQQAQQEIQDLSLYSEFVQPEPDWTKDPNVQAQLTLLEARIQQGELDFQRAQQEFDNWFQRYTAALAVGEGARSAFLSALPSSFPRGQEPATIPGTTVPMPPGVPFDPFSFVQEGVAQFGPSGPPPSLPARDVLGPTIETWASLLSGMAGSLAPQATGPLPSEGEIRDLFPPELRSAAPGTGAPGGAVPPSTSGGLLGILGRVPLGPAGPSLNQLGGSLGAIAGGVQSPAVAAMLRGIQDALRDQALATARGSIPLRLPSLGFLP